MGVVADHHNPANAVYTARPEHSPAPEGEGWDAVVRACAQVASELEKAVSRFWNVPVRIKFFCVSQRQLYFWMPDEFYVSQLMLNAPAVPEALKNQYIAQLRLSDQSCGGLLNEALGPATTGQTAREFNFSRMTRLEAMLMQEFSRELFYSLTRNLIRKKVKTSQEADILHLVWLIQPAISTTTAGHTEKPLFFKESLGAGKIVLTVPRQALCLEDVDTPEPLPDELFLHATAPVRLRLGATRVPLLDLQHLEPGDLVLLEQSDASRMFLVEPESGEAFPFEAVLPNRARLQVPDASELEMLMEREQETAMSAKQTLWDNLLIEVNAEFEPIKLPLHQLKQMSEGLVVELGDLSRNAIALQVEGKTVAHGELVIVGDRFGVRIVRVEGVEQGLDNMGADNDTPKVLSGDAEPLPQLPAEASAPEDEEKDDFLDEFDDNFDDEEEGEW